MEIDMYNKIQPDLDPNQRKLYVNMQKTAVFLCLRMRRSELHFARNHRLDIGMLGKVLATVKSYIISQQNAPLLN
jgi:hypothetical protein